MIENINFAPESALAAVTYLAEWLALNSSKYIVVSDYFRGYL
jgi:hypothetical protein